jgi:CRP-like cAMP-binding protein
MEVFSQTDVSGHCDKTTITIKKTMKNILFDFISKYVSLTEDEKNEILSLDIFRSVKKGTILLKNGQKSQDEYFILKGCIRKYYLIDGEEKTTAFFTEMEGLTPHCAINNAPSEYFVSCVEDTILTVANTKLGVELFDKFPKFQIMCRILSEELLAKQQINFDEFKTSSPEQRYLSLLQKRPDLIQRVPQHQLASYLGIIPQSLSRLRARVLEKSKE